MEGKLAYVIRDNDGNYIAPENTFMQKEDGGWLYCSLTGLVGGFAFYNIKKIAETKVKKLQSINNNHKFGKEFYIEHTDINKIRKGKYIIVNIVSIIKNKEFIYI